MPVESKLNAVFSGVLVGHSFGLSLWLSLKCLLACRSGEERERCVLASATNFLIHNLYLHLEFKKYFNSI